MPPFRAIRIYSPLFAEPELLFTYIQPDICLSFGLSVHGDRMEMLRRNFARVSFLFTIPLSFGRSLSVRLSLQFRHFCTCISWNKFTSWKISNRIFSCDADDGASTVAAFDRKSIRLLSSKLHNFPIKYSYLLWHSICYPCASVASISGVALVCVWLCSRTNEIALCPFKIQISLEKYSPCIFYLDNNNVNTFAPSERAHSLCTPPITYSQCRSCDNTNGVSRIF